MNINKKNFCNEIIGLTALAIYSSYKIYRKYFTEIGRKCEKSKNPNLCYIQVRIEAIKKQIEFLKNNIRNCNKEEKPIDCKDKIERKINYLNNKLSKKILKKKKYLRK